MSKSPTLASPVPHREAGGSAIARRSRLVAAAAVIALFGGGACLLHAEMQWQVVAVVAAFGGILWFADRTAQGRGVVAACHAVSTFGNGTAVLAALCLTAAFHEDHYALLMVATVALFATACVGVSVQLAFAGIANFAAAAFFTVGAYTAALLGGTRLPHPLVVASGGLIAAILGLVLLLPVLRTRGHYAALVTIAFGLMLRTFLEVDDTLGGPQGLKVPAFQALGVDFGAVTSLAGVEVSFYLPYALLAMAMFGLAFGLARRLERSWVGLAIDAVRTDEVAAAAFGLSPARWKATAFIVGNAMIGAAGALYGMMNGFVTPNMAGLGESLILLSIVVLGGVGNLWGCVGAAAVMLVLPEKLQAIQEYRLLIFAVLVIAILRFRPAGILPRPTRDLSDLLSRRPETGA